MNQKSCDKPGCVGKGTFTEEICPGSDSEDQHCVHCGELWWTEKGLNCELCDDYHCPLSWQKTFAGLDNCEHNDALEEISTENICHKCFLITEKLHCLDPSCNLNVKVATDNYEAFMTRTNDDEDD